MMTRLLTVALLMMTTAAPVPVGTPAPPPRAAIGVDDAMTTSFFEPFDRLDLRRWYVSDGWVNGPIQGCTWSRSAAGVKNGVLKLRLFKAANPLRAYVCGEVRTHAKLGYGWYEVRMRAAAGSGLNSAMFTYSGPPLTKVHDEIDFEFLGKETGTVQLNYFVNARGDHGSVPRLGFDASESFNHYAFEWTPGRIRWFANGKLLRTASDATMPAVGGQYFVSLWNGATPVDDWLGRFDPAAAPATAEVDWIAYTRSGERCRFPESTSCRY